MKKLFFLMLLVLPLAFVSCGSDDEPNFPDQSIVAGNTYNIPGNETGWTSDNELIASVTGSTVKAERVGVTYIRNGKKSFKVTVTGKYNTYKEPCMQWGASKSTVKSFMSGYTLSSESDEYLFYSGQYPVSIVGYSFKNGALSLSSVIIPYTSVAMDDLVAFMAERYVYVTQDKENNYFGFATPDAKNIVILQLETLNSQIVYFISYAQVTSSSAPATSVKMMAQKQGLQYGSEVKSIYRQLDTALPKMKSEYNIINPLAELSERILNPADGSVIDNV